MSAYRTEKRNELLGLLTSMGIPHDYAMEGWLPC
jgi:hypothetical protein